MLSKFAIAHRCNQNPGTLPTCTKTHYCIELLAQRKTTHFYTVHSLINKHTKHINTWKQYADTYEEICKCAHK